MSGGRRPLRGHPRRRQPHRHPRPRPADEGRSGRDRRRRRRLPRRHGPEAGPGGPRGGRPPQGRVPRHARPRAPQPGLGDRQRPQARLASGSSDEDLRWSIDVIDRQLAQLVRLLDDLLDVSRIASGKIRSRDASRSNSRGSSSAPSSRSGRFVDARGHALTVVVSPEPMPLDADPTRLVQVLANLLNNAAKYTDRGGEITPDRGPGGRRARRPRPRHRRRHPARDAPRVFDLFAQVRRRARPLAGRAGDRPEPRPHAD